MLFGKKKRAYEKFVKVTALMLKMNIAERREQAQTLAILGKETDAKRMLKKVQEDTDNVMKACGITDEEMKCIRRNLYKWSDKASGDKNLLKHLQ